MRRSAKTVAGLALALILAACGGTEEAAAPAPTAPAPSGTTAPEPAPAPAARFAMILPGPIQDADYNAIGYEAVQAVGAEFGIDAAYSEQVPVADAERVAREYIADGYDIIAFHGGQFVTVVQTLAGEYPDVVFIAETSGSLADQPENVWTIARYFAPGFFVQGALAAAQTQTGTVAFLGGIDIPDYKGGANAFFAGARSVDPAVKLLYTFSGDQNDAVKGRQSAEALIGQGADVLVLGVNNAIYGVAEAAASAPRPVFLTSNFTDKQTISPDLFLNSTIWDFAGAYTSVVRSILAGERTGELEMSVASGLITLSPLYNVSADVQAKVDAVLAGVVNGSISVPLKTDEVVLP